MFNFIFVLTPNQI